MNIALLIAGCALVGATAANAHADPLVEEGFERGALAVAAIERRDWGRAEALLDERRGVDADDPARLINLGRVYMATGRPGQALSAWRLAAASPAPYLVATVDGRYVSTRQLASEALARHDVQGRSASR